MHANVLFTLLHSLLGRALTHKMARYYPLLGPLQVQALLRIADLLEIHQLRRHQLCLLPEQASHMLQHHDHFRGGLLASVPVFLAQVDLMIQAIFLEGVPSPSLLKGGRLVEASLMLCEL